MNIYTIFSEDYFHFIESFFLNISKKYSRCQFSGLGIRRKTINLMVRNSPLNIKSYSWLNSVEKQWLDDDYSKEKVEKYRQLLGDKVLRDLIISDREFGCGFLSAGLYAQTPLRKLIENYPEKRWVYICNMLDYYFNALRENKINLVFMTEITHIWELALYHVAKKLNITCTVPFYSRFGNVFVVTDNPYNIFTGSDRIFLKALSDPTTISQENLKKAKDYIHNFREKPKLVEYSQFFKQQALKQAQFFNMAKTLSKDLIRMLFISFGLMGTKNFIRQRRGLDILKENYQAFSFSRRALRGNYFENYKKDKNRPFIYFPLHFEPEASTMVFAPKFANQLHLIEQLARSMPAGYRLLVKEHLPNTGRRPLDFYQKLKKLPDVHLISPFENNFQMIKDAALTATITGTAGWESILMRKPTMIFGKTQYNSLEEGYYLCQNAGDLTADIKKALETPPANEKRLVKFVGATLEDGIELPLSYFAYAHYKKDGKKFFADYDMNPLTEKVLSYV